MVIFISDFPQVSLLIAQLGCTQFDFIEKNEPNITKTILSGIGGNFPLPTIVNPIGVYSSIEATIKDHDLKKEFGWLFFVQRARKIAKI